MLTVPQMDCLSSFGRPMSTLFNILWWQRKNNYCWLVELSCLLHWGMNMRRKLLETDVVQSHPILMQFKMTFSAVSVCCLRCNLRQMIQIYSKPWFPLVNGGSHNYSHQTVLSINCNKKCLIKIDCHCSKSQLCSRIPADFSLPYSSCHFISIYPISNLIVLNIHYTCVMFQV